MVAEKRGLACTSTGGRQMSTSTATPPTSRRITVSGSECQVLEKGIGPTTVFWAGLGGTPRWTEFHDLLAAERRLQVVSLPGQQGSERGHERLVGPLDWVAMALDVLDAVAGEPVDLIASSISGLLAGEVAALCQPAIRKLVLIGSYGLYDDADPTRNVFAEAPPTCPGFLIQDADAYKAAYGPPIGAKDAETDEFLVTAYRADEVMARLSWPFGDLKLARRLHRIVAPTLLLWGAEDRLVPPSYARRFAGGIAGQTQIKIVPEAGHLVHMDAPAQSASIITKFLAA